MQVDEYFYRCINNRSDPFVIGSGAVVTLW